MPDYTAEKKKPAQRVRDLYERASAYWSPLHEGMSEQERFLAGERFADDTGAFNRDRRQIQIRGQELSDTVASIAAQSTARPRNVEPRPIDRDDDPEAGEAMASLVELELSNPWKGFEDYYEAAIVAAREMQLGVVWMDYEPEFGEFGGELFFSFDDPRNFMWDEAYDPHHPLCGWLIRKKRVDVDIARKQYKAKWLEPDRAYQNATTHGGHPIMSAGHALMPGNHDDNKIEIWECWKKNDPTVKEDVSENVLPEDEQYLSCTAGCGWRSDPGAGLPEMIPQGCEVCGGDVERIDVLDTTVTTLAFARGRRLTVIAPWCSPGGEKKDHLYDGAWPIPRARSFPGLFLTARIKGGHPLGSSDTLDMWDQQIASDVLRTTALQRVLEHRNYWEIPRAGLVDFRNKRFEFRDDQFNVMYRDESKAQFGESPVKMHNGTGLDPAFAQVFQITQQALTQYRGVTDLGMTPESSKDIAVGTVQELVRQGSMQIEHFDRRKNRALGKFYGVVSDYIAAIYTPRRLARLNLDGVDMLMRVMGDDFPNFDFVITDSSPFTGVEKVKAESAQMLIQAAQELPDFWDILAEMQGHPPSVVRKIEKRLEEIKARAAAMEEAAMDEEITGDMPGDDMGPGMVPGLNSPNGAGMIQ